MTQRSIFANLVRSEDGAFSTAYGPFVLQSALQPIFRLTSENKLEIDALEGLVRVSRDNEPVSPAEFFRLVSPADIALDPFVRREIVSNSIFTIRDGVQYIERAWW